jgi:hypothetical protein
MADAPAIRDLTVPDLQLIYAQLYEFNFVSKDSKAVNQNNNNKKQITSKAYSNENIKNKSENQNTKQKKLKSCCVSMTETAMT